MQPKLFEHLLDADGIYSIMLKGKKNLRILFDFQEFQGEKSAVLYNCFQEKRTKDYSEEIKTAKIRRKEIFGNQIKEERK